MNLNSHNFLSNLDGEIAFATLKRTTFFLLTALIQLTCHQNKFLNNLTKTIKIEVFSARFSHYSIRCSLSCAASTKTKYLIVIWVKFSFSSNEFQSLPILVLELHTLEKPIQNLRGKVFSPS